MSGRIGRVIMMAATAALALLAAIGPVAAHHILGIPHYKYDEHYPQIPYLEVVAQVGDHDLVFTHFPGFPSPGESIRFKIYIRNRVTGEPFRDPLPVQVLRRRFLRAPTPAMDPITIRPGTGPESNDYKFFLAFDRAEAYEVAVSFPLKGGVEVIPFPVVIGRTDDRPLIFGAAGLLLGAVVTVALVKKRRRIRARRARPVRKVA